MARPRLEAHGAAASRADRGNNHDPAVTVQGTGRATKKGVDEQGRDQTTSKVAIKQQPPARDDVEPLRPLLQPVAPRLPLAVERHLDAPAPFLFEPLREGAGIGSVRPDQFQARESRRRSRLDHLSCAHCIVQTRGVDVSQEDQARGVHQNVALAPERLFARVEAPLGPACTRGPCRLRVDHGGGGLPIPPFLLAGVLAQPVVHALQRAVLAPAGQLRVDRRPRWDVAWEHAPGAA